MASVRLIPRLDIKGQNLIKGIHLEGLRVIGEPNKYAQAYYRAGADELLYIDAVASLYGRENLLDIVHHTTRDVFIPITAGGGVRTLTDVQNLLNAGADKVAINTGAVQNPEIIRDIAQRFGSQCVVLSVEAIRQPSGNWEAFTDCGRESTGLDVVDWVQHAESLGAGEILVTSVDKEGTRKGFDINLVQSISSAVSIPVIASGGMGSVDHLMHVVEDGGANAVSMADILHYNRMALEDLRYECFQRGLETRKI